VSKTDKTKPARVKLREAGAKEVEFYYKGRPIFYDIPNDMRWTNAERGFGPSYVRWAKRYRSKKNRRRDIPIPQMRGHGYGEENYRY
jgi:hypothetical protein